MRNEERSIAELIDSIKAQTRMPDEVILVDGGSTDQTVARAKELTAGDPRFLVLCAGSATPGRGRNVGIEAASHNWVALTDAGIKLEPDWLRQLLAVAENNPDADVVYGSYEPQLNSFFERCAALWYVAPRQLHDERPMRGPSTASMLVRWKAWESVGGFPDLRAAEDLIFFEKLSQHNHRAAWAPQAVVHWQLQPSFASTFRKFQLYSKHNVWAGRMKDWHYGMARTWLVLTALLCLALFHSTWWLVSFTLAFGARLFRRVWKHREQYGTRQVLNPAVLAGVAAVMLTVDAATFVGWGQAMVRTEKRETRSERRE